MKITFTGIDSSTNLDLLPSNVEYGILFTTNPNNRNRYPSIQEIKDISTYLSNKGFKLALHVCGSGAKELILKNSLDFINKFNRIQLNGKHSIEQIESICSLYPLHEIITQHNQNNIHLLEVNSFNHSILIDSSGGLGISPVEWTIPITTKNIGFAGGLSPDNIFSEFEKFKHLMKNDSWIDLESKLRDHNDFFSIDLANSMYSKFKILSNLNNS